MFILFLTMIFVKMREGIGEHFTPYMYMYIHMPFCSLLLQHENYNQGPGLYPNDIALLFLAEDADVSQPDIAYIEMATSEPDDFERLGVITGW